jgi:flagellar motor switch protein FliN/FliY
VSTQAPTAATALATAAASAAAATLASAEPLTPGELLADASAAATGQAVAVSFNGEHNGELVLVVDGELTGALASSSMGNLDLAAALTPAIAEIAGAIGRVALGPIEAMDARIALHRLSTFPDGAVIPLLGSGGPRAFVAVAVAPPVGADTAAARPSVEPAPLADLTSARLDLLRGVEMAATAELGRARMTVNELLTLRTGAVIELDRAAGAPADLYVNGRLIARGEVVVIDENYGIRITQVVSDDSAGR